MSNKRDIIVLWKSPLIEIVDDAIFIEDQLVWKNEKFYSVDIDKVITRSLHAAIGGIKKIG